MQRLSSSLFFLGVPFALGYAVHAVRRAADRGPAVIALVLAGAEMLSLSMLYLRALA